MKKLLLWFLCFVPVIIRAQVEPVPYAPIANPLPDTLDQLYRDSATIQIGRVRVNQAGYRPQDEKWFYYVGSASSFTVIDAATGQTAGSGQLSSTGQTTSGSIDIIASKQSTRHSINIM